MAFEGFEKALVFFKKQLLPVSGGRGMGGSVFNGYRLSVWEDKKVLERDDGDGCTIM